MQSWSKTEEIGIKSKKIEEMYGKCKFEVSNSCWLLSWGHFFWLPKGKSVWQGNINIHSQINSFSTAFAEAAAKIDYFCWWKLNQIHPRAKYLPDPSGWIWFEKNDIPAAVCAPEGFQKENCEMFVSCSQTARRMVYMPGIRKPSSRSARNRESLEPWWRQGWGAWRWGSSWVPSGKLT